MKIKIISSEAPIRVTTVSLAPEELERTPGVYAIDMLSHRDANTLVMNREDDPVLEISGGAEIAFDGDFVIALTGAGFRASLSGDSLPRYTACQVDRNDVLKIDASCGGSFLYLAINGLLDCDPGDSLSAGDAVGIDGSSETLVNMDLRALTPPATSEEGAVTLRVIPGPFADEYDLHQLDLLYTGEFTVTAADRALVALNGNKLSPSPLHSSPLYCPVGMIYASPSGDVRIARADSPETSNIKGAAVVIGVDHHRLASLFPGCKVRFRPCTVQQAEKLARAVRKAFLKTYLKINYYEV